MKSAGTSAVVEPLLALEREDLTGTLEFRARGVVTRIQCRGGEIVGAEGGVLGERLGRIMVRAGRLSEEHFGAVLRRMVDLHVSEDAAHPPVRFGQLAVEYGFLDPAELALALTQQVREKIIGCIHRGSGDWRFSPESRPSDEANHVVRTRPTLVEATRDLPERRIEDILRLDELRYPEIVAPERVITAEFELTPDERELLDDLDGTSSFQFLFSKAEVPGARTLIAALVLGGGVELRTTPAGTRPDMTPRLTPAEFRTQRREGSTVDNEDDGGDEAEGDATDQMAEPPVGRGGSRSRVATLGEDASTIAVFRPKERRSSRESLPPLTDEARVRAEEGFELLRNALETGRQQGERKRWPDPKNDRERRLMAESAFFRGHLFLRAEAAERALPGLHRALELRSEEREYELYVKWAQMIVNEAFKEDRRRTEIQTLASLVVREDRSSALAYTILGHCTLYERKDEIALRFFQRARRLDPAFVDAARSADVLTARLGASVIGRAAGSRRPKGELEPMIDEIVPSPPEDRSRRPRRRMSSHSLIPGPAPEIGSSGAHTPYGGLAAAAPIGEVPAGPMGGGTLAFGVVTSESPDGTLVMPRGPAQVPPPPGTAPLLPPSAPSAPALPTLPTPSVPPVVSARPPPAAYLHDPGHDGADVPDPENPFARGRRRRKVTVVLALLGFGLLGAAVLFAATTMPDRRATSLVDAGGLLRPSALASVTPSPSPLASLPPNASPSSAAPPPASHRPTAHAPSGGATTVAAPPPGASTEAHANANASASASGATTGILRTRGHGHRIFFDGRVIGEGGKDHTVPCGPHRARIGSAGTERAIVVPCGGIVALE